MGLHNYKLDDQAGANLYRVEYSQAPAALAWLAGLEHHDAVCSVCQAPPQRSWSVMVPGRQDCNHTALALDYAGYLMADTFGSAGKTEHICVDGQPGAVAGSSAAAASGTLYTTETGDGLSSSYVDNQEVACAQCSSSAGPTYVRWGRTTCPASATLLYSGRAAGAHHAHAGGGYNYVCLHAAPVYNETEAASNAYAARLYRVEYEMQISSNALGLMSMLHLHNKDVPCTVCQSTGSLATFMQPGSATCSQGWSTEYAGYVMAMPSAGNSK